MWRYILQHPWGLKSDHHDTSIPLHAKFMCTYLHLPLFERKIDKHLVVFCLCTNTSMPLCMHGNLIGIACKLWLLLWVYLFFSISHWDEIFRATTHTDLVVRAKKMGVEVKVIHNASVMNAIGVCGLQLYRYGETVSIPFFTEEWRPDSFYEKIQNNCRLGLHTLCLLGLWFLLDLFNFINSLLTTK